MNMKKVVRLTEQELVEVINKVISEQEVSEFNISGIVKGVGNLVKKGANYIKGKSAPKKSPYYPTSKPLNIPTDVKTALSKLPNGTVKIGPKTKTFLDSKRMDLAHLKSVYNYNKDKFNLEMVDHALYGIERSLNTAKGQPLNFNDLYYRSLLLKRELENVKMLGTTPKNYNPVKLREFESARTAASRMVGDLENFISTMRVSPVKK
jgi:hypothetical protein